MIAVAVNSLLCDAMRNLVCGVIGSFLPVSAKPKPRRPDQFLIGHHADGDAGQVAIEELALEPRAEQPLGSEHVGVTSDVRGGGRRLRPQVRVRRGRQHAEDDAGHRQSMRN